MPARCLGSTWTVTGAMSKCSVPRSDYSDFGPEAGAWSGRGAKKKTGGNGDMYLILRPSPPSSDDPRVIQLAKELEEFYPPEGIRKDFKL